MARPIAFSLLRTFSYTLILSTARSASVVESDSAVETGPVIGGFHYPLGGSRAEILEHRTFPNTKVVEFNVTDTPGHRIICEENSHFFSVQNTRCRRRYRIRGNHMFVLKTRVMFDREMTHPGGKGDLYRVNITCRDRRRPHRNTWTVIDIHVKDINDQRPWFTNLTSRGLREFEVMENQPASSEIGQLYIEDRDTGENARVTYSLKEDSQYVRIDADSGRLYSKKSFDREVTSDVSVTAIAQDHGSPPLRSPEVQVQIIVKDVNDNSPEFPTSSEMVNVPRTLVVGSEIIQVQATDADEGLNAEIEYRLDEPNEYIRIGETYQNGICYLYVNKPLSSYLGESMTVQVIAQDKGTPPKQGVTSILITIVDN